MKKKIVFCISALMSVVSVFAADDNCPVIMPAVTSTSSPIELWGSDYRMCEVHTWNIDMQDTVRIRFSYLADLSNSVDDILFIYELNSLGTPISTLLMTEDQHVSGSVVSVGKSGKARVVLVSQYGGNNGLYNGIKVWYEAHSDSGGDSVVVLNGNVGIDIQPQEKLHVNGAVRGDGANGSLRIKTTSGTTEIGSGSSLFSHFYTDRPAFYFSKPLYVNGGVINSYGTSPMLHFRAGGNTDKMLIDGEGVEVLGDLTTENVTAYGTMYVDDTLSLGGPIRGHKTSGSVRIQTDNAWVDIGSTHPAFTHFYTNASKFYFDKPISIHGGIISSIERVDLQLQTFNTTHLTIQYGTGNVGIGTVLPKGKLHVNGGRLKIGNGAGLNDRQKNLIQIGDSNYVEIGEFERDDVLSFKAKDYNFTNGNVGIKTSTPQSTLDVNGDIHTDSITARWITANVIIVEPISGADYVFDRNYKLRPLTDIDSYIQQNGHLPEIPSAAEMQQKGVNMPELQMQLLQKIEELTLYMIEQEKRIQELSVELEKLKGK